ncbi:GNAT family N-acetyltransferase [Spirosoma sp. KNUC1025]|nr:GNAT family N-acetyltransferase [Spirosoma sp. KNUC1025]
MAGRRFASGTYVEISAVCRHPDHTGKGYARRLIESQIRQIRAEGKLPYLHVWADNCQALAIYERMGFVTRSDMMIYILAKR